MSNGQIQIPGPQNNCKSQSQQSHYGRLTDDREQIACAKKQSSGCNLRRDHQQNQNDQTLIIDQKENHIIL